MTEEIEPAGDCRCLGPLPDELHPRGAPGCVFPADLSDPRKRFIANEIDLGIGLRMRLKSWGLTTLGDLVKHGAFAEVSIPVEERTGGWPLYRPALMDVRGLGRVKLLRIRKALAKYDLALVDEEQINRHWSLEPDNPPDEGA